MDNATENKKSKMMEKLFRESSPQVEKKSSELEEEGTQFTPYGRCNQCVCTDVIEYLIDNGLLRLEDHFKAVGALFNLSDPTIEQTDKPYHSLLTSVSRNSIEVIGMLLEDGTHHNISDSKSPCPIFTAIGCENLNIVHILNSHEAVLEVRNEDGNPTFTGVLCADVQIQSEGWSVSMLSIAEEVEVEELLETIGNMAGIVTPIYSTEPHMWSENGQKLELMKEEVARRCFEINSKLRPFVRPEVRSTFQDESEHFCGIFDRLQQPHWDCNDKMSKSNTSQSDQCGSCLKNIQPEGTAEEENTSFGRAFRSRKAVLPRVQGSKKGSFKSCALRENTADLSSDIINEVDEHLSFTISRPPRATEVFIVGGISSGINNYVLLRKVGVDSSNSLALCCSCDGISDEMAMEWL
ncbi:hypothetical protein ACTXT7_016764 [Hymenolepis weldensis]